MRILVGFFLLVLTACESTKAAPQLLTEGKDYLVSTSFDEESQAIMVSIQAHEAPVCVNPGDWPSDTGRISSLGDPLTILRDDQVYKIEEVRLDGGRGKTLRIQSGKRISGSVPLSSFYGISEWVGTDEIRYNPRVSTCD